MIAKRLGQDKQPKRPKRTYWTCNNVEGPVGYDKKHRGTEWE